MKSFFTFSFSLLILLLASCGPKPETTIDGIVTGAPDGAKVYLLDNKHARIDSTTVAGGKFRFAIAKVYPDRNSIALEGLGTPLRFVVEPGTITATIDATTTPPTAVFAGTPTNDGIAAGEDAMKQADPASVLAAYYAYSTGYNLTTPEMVDSVLTIIAAAPANAFTDRLKERREVLTKTAVGVQAPDFTQAQADGTPLSLSSLRGKVVLVDFWASWCGPCRRENPNVVKMYERFKDKGFEILGVSLDDNREDWLQAIADDGLVWKHVSDLKGWQNAVAEQYAVRSIPHTVLVGADGVIVAKNLRGEALQTKVAEALGVN